MNDFYKQPKILQWIEAILLLLFGFIPALAIIEIGYSHPIYYLLLIIYVPVGQFSFTLFLNSSVFINTTLQCYLAIWQTSIKLTYTVAVALTIYL
jgi:hypothetical protein